MDGIIFDKVRCGLDRAGGIDAHHFDIFAPRSRDVRKGTATDTAKSVDTYFDRHGGASFGKSVTLCALYLEAMARLKV